MVRLHVDGHEGHTGKGRGGELTATPTVLPDPEGAVYAH